MTASYGKTVNAGNIYEIGGDSFMRKEQNPYLNDVVFLNQETFMQANSVVYTGPQQYYEQTYLTDPANRGMLVLGTYNNGEDNNKDFTTLRTVRSGKESIMDQCKDNRILSYRFVANTTNDNILKHVIEAHDLTPLQDFTPPFRVGMGHIKRYRFGTLSANILSAERVDKLIAEFNTGGDFFIMRQTDQQGRDLNKTHFAAEMRKSSSQDEGRAAAMALVQAEYQGNLTFFPVAGTMNKFWGVIDKVLTREQITNLLNKVNKIRDRDKNNPLKTFMSYAMGRVTTFLEGAGVKEHIFARGPQQRRVNTASIAITGWPQQAEPAQVQAILKQWGVEIDLSLVSIDWYFGTEAEGFTLKIETTDLSKAREILLLRERVNFDMGVGEMTASQQSCT
jgi:hypothetical protein